MTLTLTCHPARTCSVLPKQVRSALFVMLPLSDADFFSGAVTAIMTNPIWVVKVRMFTTKADSPTAYRSLWRLSIPIFP